jgi:hypothetical protein
VAVQVVGPTGARIRIVGVVLDYKYLNIRLLRSTQEGARTGARKRILEAEELARREGLPLIRLDEDAWVGGPPAKMR